MPYRNPPFAEHGAFFRGGGEGIQGGAYRSLHGVFHGKHRHVRLVPIEEGEGLFEISAEKRFAFGTELLPHRLVREGALRAEAGDCKGILKRTAEGDDFPLNGFQGFGRKVRMIPLQPFQYGFLPKGIVHRGGALGGSHGFGDFSALPDELRYTVVQKVDLVSQVFERV